MKDGGPAFATGDKDGLQEGMTLRDYFAGQALAGMSTHTPHDYSKGACNASLADRAYAVADAMLAERESR